MLSSSPLSLLTVLAVVISGARSDCPDVDAVPVMYATGEEFTCARVYHGVGDVSPLQACQGCGDGEYTDYPDNYNYPGDWESYLPCGSLLVKAGCTLYGYPQPDFPDWRDSFEGPLLIPNVEGQVPAEGGCASGYRGLQCRCTQEPVDCQPEDKFEVILSCDNTNGITDVSCSYSKTIGTTFTEDIAAGMAVDTNVEFELRLQFFNIFGTELNVSHSTGYNWNKISSASQSDAEAFEVSAVSPPGYILLIEQTVGYCDRSTVQTEMFRISHIDGTTGKADKIIYEH